MANEQCVIFKGVREDGLTYRTKVSWKDGYFAISDHGKALNWRGFPWGKLQLVDIFKTQLPMHFWANSKYFWGNKNFKALSSLIPDMTEAQVEAYYNTSPRGKPEDEVYIELMEPAAKKWLSLVQEAFTALKAHEGQEVWLTEQPSFTEGEWIDIEGYGKQPCEVLGEDPMWVQVGDCEFNLFHSKGEAGRAARQYWEDMANNDPKEFAFMMGEETLVAWGMNALAGPGTSKVHGLEEWLDLWLDTPHEHFASYDGEECQVLAHSQGLSDIDPFTVAYRTN